MCLLTLQNKAVLAKKDIVCYKVVKKYEFGFEAKFYSLEYKIGETYNEAYFKEALKSNYDVSYIDDNNNKVYRVERGFHTYRTLAIAQDERWGNEVILKCIIPAGAKFYSSKDNDQHCSNKIKIIAYRKYGKWFDVN